MTKKRFNKGSSDRPLSIDLRGSELVIRVGTGTLAWAFDYNADNNPWNDEKNSYVQSWKVTDPKQFAEDVRIAALDESEDGSSPLTRFLDQICQSAVEAGSLGISESGEVSEG